MLIRVRASGCIEDVFDFVGKQLIAAGAADPVIHSGLPAPETAAMVPHRETAMLPAPRILNPLRRLFGAR